MKQELFMELLHVAIDDYQAYDPAIEGVILITVARDKDGDLAAQMGASVSPEDVTAVLSLLSRHLARGAAMTRIPQRNKYRKAV